MSDGQEVPEEFPKKEKEKPDCYKCDFRGQVPGSAHSSCNHPAYNDPQIKCLAILKAAGMMPGLTMKIPGMIVKGNQMAIRRGYFQHPIDFDPLWMEECTGFKEKKNNSIFENGYRKL